MRILILFLLLSNMVYSQKVTITPISFHKEFELKNAGMKNVLKDYTEFASSPFKKIPTGFTLSKSSVFYKFDTLNCSLFIKKREDVDSLIYYRDCEDGRWCQREFNSEYHDERRKRKKSEISKRYNDWIKFENQCCDLEGYWDTTILFYNNEFIEFSDVLVLDKNLPVSIVSNSYVTNLEYHEFVNYCIDLIRRNYLAANHPQKYFLNYDDKIHPSYNSLNYDVKYDINDPELMPILSQMYFGDHEKYYWKRQLDNRKIYFYDYEIPTKIKYTDIIWKNYNKSIFHSDYREVIKNCSLEGANYNYSHLLDLQLMSHNKIESLKEKEDQHMAYLLKSHDCNPSVNCYPDTLTWIYSNPENTISNVRIWASENYFKNLEFNNLPVQGVNYLSAKSFLTWKTKFHNQELIRQNLPFRVLYTFPFPEESSKINSAKIDLPIIDMNKYIITNKEYEEFVIYVSDSVIIRNMSKYEPAKYLYPSYDDNGEERPDSDWLIDKSWNKKYYQKAFKKLESLNEFKHFEELLINIDSNNIKYDGFDNRRFYYSYMWINYDKNTLFQERDINLTNEIDYAPIYVHGDRSRLIIRDKVQVFPGYDKIEFNRFESEKNWKEISKYLEKCDSLGTEQSYPDSLSTNKALFWELNPRYILEQNYSMPFKTYDFKSSPDSSITAITYEQAKAYYHWKNEVPYIPTKEEWNLIKQGINPYEEKELEVPGPFFRYVIRVYPVREE